MQLLLHWTGFLDPEENALIEDRSIAFNGAMPNGIITDMIYTEYIPVHLFTSLSSTWLNNIFVSYSVVSC